MVMLEDPDPPQDSFFKGEATAAPPLADDKAMEADRGKQSGGVTCLEKDFAVLFVNTIVSFMLISHTALMLTPPKPDDCKEQGQDKGEVHVPILKYNLQENTKKPPLTSIKNSTKKAKPKPSKKKGTAQKFSHAPSALRNILSKFSSLVACMTRNVLRKPKCHHVLNTRIIRIPLYFMLFAFSVQAVVSAPTTDIETDQTLPDLCKNKFHEMKHCPGFDSDNLNGVCCGSSPAKVLHCLSRFDENRQKDILSVACFPDTEVEPGYVIDITFKNGLPQKDLIPCGSGFYEPNLRNSSQIPHPYCLHSKTGCLDEDRRQRLCQGGIARDDQCICKPEFEPQYWNTSQSPCAQGFNHKDMCHCVAAPCPPGQARDIDYLYNPTQQCPTQVSRFNYTCVETGKTSTATYPPTQSIKNITQEPVTSTSKTETANQYEDTNPEGQKTFPYFLLLIFVATCSLLIIGIVVYIFKFSNTGYFLLREHN